MKTKKVAQVANPWTAILVGKSRVICRRKGLPLGYRVIQLKLAKVNPKDLLGIPRIK